jgi:hypothetical protein
MLVNSVGDNNTHFLFFAEGVTGARGHDERGRKGKICGGFAVQNQIETSKQ